LQPLLSTTAAFKGGRLSELRAEIGPHPLARAAYFRLKDSIATISQPNVNIRISASYTVTGVTSLPGD